VSITLVSFGVATLLALGLVVGVTVFNYLIGTVEFFIGGPRIDLLKTTHGTRGFAFGLNWNHDKEPASFNLIRVRLFDPFGNKTQLEVSKKFDAMNFSSAIDLDLGPAMQEIYAALDLGQGTLLIEVQDLNSGTSHQKEMTVKKYLKLRSEIKMDVAEFKQKFTPVDAPILYSIPSRSFIAEAPVQTGKKLKLATNPEFVGDFATVGAASGAAAAGPNFSISKVWIEPGCIVCDACETIYPEVFEVLDKTCVIRAGAPLTDGNRVQEAAEACPVEVIKFTRI
jgi:ferredoxin